MMSFNPFRKKATDTLSKNAANSDKQLKIAARWEKERADGKWFWIFRRACIWLLTVIMAYGAATIVWPDVPAFDASQFFIVLFMLAGYVASLMMDWAKLEETYRGRSLTND
jgi:hypothetical protein